MNWFKAATLSALCLIAFSFFYYYVIFLPRLERTRVERETQERAKLQEEDKARKAAALEEREKARRELEQAQAEHERRVRENEAKERERQSSQPQLLDRADAINLHLVDTFRLLQFRFNQLGNNYGALEEMNRIMSEMENAVYQFRLSMGVLLVEATDAKTKVQLQIFFDEALRKADGFVLQMRKLARAKEREILGR